MAADARVDSLDARDSFEVDIDHVGVVLPPPRPDLPRFPASL
jgi:hypothetical protein